MIIKKHLNLKNLIKAQIFHIPKLIKVIEACKDKKFVSAVF